MVVSCHQNVEQNHSSLVVNKFIENVAKFKYMETIDIKITLTKKVGAV
jgi:hypothetical protein